MSGLILGRAHEPGVGMCLVEQIGRDTFRLIPDNNPNNRLIRQRTQVRWRKARSRA